MAPSGKDSPTRGSTAQLGRECVEVDHELDVAAADAQDAAVDARRRFSRQVASEREQLEVEPTRVVVSADGSSFERSKVSRACGSGTASPEKAAKAANSRRRPPRGVRDRRVDVVGEEQERPLLTVLLALEEQRRLRREQRDGGAETELLGPGPVAERAVADLVVVLRADDEPLGRLAVELGGETLEGAVFRVVAVVLAREQDVQLVVQLVRPLGVVTPLSIGRKSPVAISEMTSAGRTRSASSARTCFGESSETACVASRRSPSMP